MAIQTMAQEEKNYLGTFRDKDDGELYTVYTIEGDTAYIRMAEGYFTHSPVSLVKKMIDKNLWVRSKS